MNKLITILLIGFFFISCGNNQQNNEDLNLPNISYNKKYQRIFRALDGGKVRNSSEDIDTEIDNNDTTDTTIDDTTPISETDMTAPEQNRNIVSEPFKAIEDIFTTQYNNFPIDSTHHKTENSINFITIDNNGIVHIIVSSIAWWLKDGDSSMSRDFQYYYVNYNPSTKEKSTPKKIFENKSLNSGNLPYERIVDFIIYNDKPIFITFNSKNYVVKRYMLDGSSQTINTESGNKIDNLKLINFDNKIYLTYRSLPNIDNSMDWRFKAIEIYPNIGSSHNIVDKYLGLGRINNSSIFFYRDGVFYTLDNNMKAIELSKEIIETPQKYLYGKVKIYDLSVKELLLDNKFNIIILNQDNSQENIFQITDSMASIGNYHSHLITASVYKDKVILAYGIHTDTDKWKVVIFDRYTKETASIIIGNRINSNLSYQSDIAINKNKQFVIGNIDGAYNYSAQLTIANILSSKSTKDKILTEVNSMSFGYYTDKYNQRWYISSADSSKRLNVYSLMPIKNGNAGWGIIGKNIANINLDMEKITIGDISDVYTNQYSVIYNNKIKIIDSNLLQADIEKIRNSTVNIKWWFFTVDKAWFIINKDGDIYRFSSKEEINEEGIKQEVYDWKRIDLEGAMPTFFVEDGVKKFRF